MKYVLVGLSLLYAIAATAAPLKPTYLVNMKPVSAEQALMVALKGGEVLACRQVEAKASKAGTSIGLRNKKAKVADE